MTNGISTSPHCLYKSNIVDDVIINKTRQNELVKVFCEYKTEFLILFDDFFRSHNLPKEGANKRGNSSRLTQSFHFFMFEPIFSPVNALNQPI